MDELDRRILDVLRHNGRISNRDLAAAVNLSPSPCLRRVRRLEKSGVIRGYRADIREPETGQRLCVFVGVRVRHHAGEHVRRFVSEVIKLPEVLECHHVTGDLDYLLRVEVPDLAAYEEFHANKLADIPGIGTVTSYVAMTTVENSETVVDLVARACASPGGSSGSFRVANGSALASGCA